MQRAGFGDVSAQLLRDGHDGDPLVAIVRR
jgi:hypothetical protein